MQHVKNLAQLIRNFSDEQKCRDFLVQQRWNGSPVCPYCNCEKWYSIENGKRFKCGNKECYKKYSVTVGTIFHASNIPLSTWFPAMYLVSNHKKGISSCQLAKDLGICQKTAWFMIHRIRESLRPKEVSLLKNTVEVDEVYIGAKQKNLSNKKRAEIKENNDSAYSNKVMVIGMIERGGELRLQTAGDSSNRNTIAPIVYDNVDKGAFLMTDGEGAYVTVGKNYAGHQSVNHGIREYVRDGEIHTNTIEGAFGLFRRTIIGIYHKISPKHLSRYCDEMQYRYNTRDLKDGERFEIGLGRLETRLSWKELTKYNGLTEKAIIEPQIPELKISKQGMKAMVCKMVNGEVMATYNSIKEASEATGIHPASISRVVRGLRLATGGFEWKYV